MCGIAGYLGFTERAQAVTLQRMLGAISHRGPDQFGGFIDGGTALGCARLSIVDLEGGTQPAVSREHRIAVVFNGEIFNYLDLRAKLKVAFRTRSEVETLLHLYIIHGTEMFQMLNGQFAIAIWDGRGSDTLIMARDGVGIPSPILA